MPPGRKPAADWPNVDWNQGDEELAQRLGVKLRTVATNRRRYGHAPQPAQVDRVEPLDYREILHRVDRTLLAHYREMRKQRRP